MKKYYNVFFIWGYGSDPNCDTAKNLQKLLSKHNIRVYSDYYAQYNPEEAIKDIEQYIKDYNIDLIVGSSLGGYIAMQIKNVPKVIINPCVHPEIELELLEEEKEYEDPNTHEKQVEFVKSVPEHIVEYYKNYIKEHDVWENHSNDVFSAAVFGNNDELLGDRYVNETSEHINNIIRSEQGHRNTYKSLKESVVPVILNYFNKNEE